MIIVTSLRTNKSIKYPEGSMRDCLIKGHVKLNPQVKYNPEHDSMFDSVMFKNKYYYTLFDSFAIDTESYK